MTAATLRRFGNSAAAEPDGGGRQAAWMASWWLWSLRRLWVAMQRRHSVLTAARPAAVEAGDAAVVFGVAEDGLDDVLSLPVERLAVFGGQDAAHEVEDAALPTGPGCGPEPRFGPDQDRDAVAR